MYEVQIFKQISEGHLTKEMNAKAAEGWRVVATTIHDKFGLIVTWQRT